MQKLINKKIRTFIKNKFSEMNNIYKKDFNKAVNITDIDELISLINQKQKNGRKQNTKYYNDEFTLANSFILCLSTIFLSVYSKDYEEELFPKDWLSEREIPNPNFIIGNLLLQLINYSLAIVDLIEKDLDNPARTLVRSLFELSSQIIILIYNQDDFKEYTKGSDDTKSTEIWYKLFAKNKLHNKISIIEQKIGNDNDIIKYMHKFRKDNHEFFSQNVHHSYISTNIGAYAQKINNEEELESSLFGGENGNITVTITFLNTSLWFFLLYFFKIINKPKNPKELFWLEALSLYQVSKDLYMNIYCNVDTNKTEERITYRLLSSFKLSL